MSALKFGKGSEPGRYIATTDDLAYCVVKHDGRWWLSIYSTETLKDVERIEAHDTRTLAYAVANAYESLRSGGYVSAEHGYKNLLTTAIGQAYDA